MLFDFVPLLMVQMPVVQVVDVVSVFHRQMTAGRAVMMRMLGVGEMLMRGHESFSFHSVQVRGRVALAGMGDGVLDEIENVQIRDRVNDRLSDAPAAHQRAAEEP